MLECLVLGDSIASGIASVMPECVRMTEIGINSGAWWQKNHNRPFLDMESYKFVVVSLGTNDLESDNLRNNLKLIRKKIQSDRVIWVLPSKTVKSQQMQIVQKFAWDNMDLTISIDNFTGSDKIHPPTVEAYEKIAKLVRGTVK